MLKVGVIGYGDRLAGMVRIMRQFNIPFQITAICDPRESAIKTTDDENVKQTRFYDSAEKMLETEAFDGVMIGTRCTLHAPMAAKVAEYNLPIFLEKPVAVSFEQLKMLREKFTDYKPQVVVSFPLRVSPILRQVKEIVDAGQIGTIDHVVACNDVPYGTVYFNHWYRDYDEVGGLFLQKATHDFDYLAHLIGYQPRLVCAMHSQRVYGGNKPAALKCKDCDEQIDCPESPFNLFYQQYEGKQVQQTDWRLCVWSRGLKNEDSGNCIIEYSNGVQVSYTQNFFARHQAARRGARLYGYKGTIDFDWYRNDIKIFSHQQQKTETITYTAEAPHFGGDFELCRDWLLIMQGKVESRSPIQAGIESVLTCLRARESAEKKCYCEIRWP